MIRPSRFAFFLPLRRPLERLMRRIFFVSITSRNLKEDSCWPIIGRMKSFAVKSSNLLVIYGTIFSSAASPPPLSQSRSRIDSQSDSCFSRASRGGTRCWRARARYQRMVEPLAGSSITSWVALRKYCSKAGPCFLARRRRADGKIIKSSLTMRSSAPAARNRIPRS